jgi:hypothetical protein
MQQLGLLGRLSQAVCSKLGVHGVGHVSVTMAQSGMPALAMPGLYDMLHNSAMSGEFTLAKALICCPTLQVPYEDQAQRKHERHSPSLQ